MWVWFFLLFSQIVARWILSSDLLGTRKIVWMLRVRRSKQVLLLILLLFDSGVKLRGLRSTWHHLMFLFCQRHANTALNSTALLVVNELALVQLLIVNWSDPSAKFTCWIAADQDSLRQRLLSQVILSSVGLGCVSTTLYLHVPWICHYRLLLLELTLDVGRKRFIRQFLSDVLIVADLGRNW